jgi:PPIC-type PPIASE domain
MKSFASPLLLVALALALWQQPASQEAPSRPTNAAGHSADSALASPAESAADLVLRCADGLTISRQEYAEYLLAISGRRPLQDLLRLRLYTREAERLGLSLDDAALTSTAEERLGELLETRHRGDESALAAELEASGFDLPSYRQMLLNQLRSEALESSLVLASRSTDEASLRLRFEREYGPAGKRTALRHLMLTRAQLRADLIAAGEPADSLSIERLDARLRTLMGEFRARVLAGEDFATLCASASHDAATRAQGGRIDNYRAPSFGPAFAAAVAGAAPGDLIGPLEGQSGWHLIELLEHKVVRFEDVRAELLERLISDPANVEERFLLRQRLESACRPEYF